MDQGRAPKRSASVEAGWELQASRSDGVEALISDALATRGTAKHGRHAPVAAAVIVVLNNKKITSSFSLLTLVLVFKTSFKLETYFSRANCIAFAARLHYKYKKQEEKTSDDWTTETRRRCQWEAQEEAFEENAC